MPTGHGLAIGATPTKVVFRPGDPINADQWVDSPTWVEVASSNVSGISYDKENKNLFVEFQKGGIYIYHQVPQHVAKNMFNSNSMGKYVWRYLRDKYSYRKI